jgi:hypothetical protein
MVTYDFNKFSNNLFLILIVNIILILMVIPITGSAQAEDSIDIITGTIPTIDGIISQGEWVDANSVQIQTPDGERISVYYKHDKTNLYIGFDTNTEYFAEIYFDTSNNGGLRPQNDDLLLHASGALYEQQGTGFDWGESNYEITGWNASTMYEGNGQIEYSISFLKIGIIPSTTSIIGVSFSITDSLNLRYCFYWPVDANRKNPNTWGDMSSSDNWGFQENLPPTALPMADPTGGPAPLTVSFIATGTDSDGEIVEYYWYFDDGSTSNEKDPTHTFQDIGTYDVQLTVTDDDDAEDTATIRINVTEKSDDVEPPSDNDKTNDTAHEEKKEEEKGFLPAFEILLLLAGIIIVISIFKIKKMS